MDLSIIIVNYNVRHFLEQCLISVKNAVQHLNVEILVVDNHSVDGSVEFLKTCQHPIRCIFSNQNLGFSKANNRALELARGKYILLLNPDTIVAEDALIKTVAYMEAHPQAGALGIRMLDSNGRFLPESKRGLPSPAVAFYKLFGLSALFPKSKRFGQYHLSYLNPHQTQRVDVLSGAFMLIRASVIKAVGGLDERFFMYGEDIDLSYRITQAGYENIYFAESSIIHHKGESTKKGNLNYVRMFYGAMGLFVQKHRPRQTSQWFIYFIHGAIWFRAALTLLASWIQKLFLPLTDAGFILCGLYLCKGAYEVWFKLYPNFYSDSMLRLFFPLYAVIWAGSMFLSGAYDPPYQTHRAYRGLLQGSVFILVVYSLLPEYYRFSRALILLGAVLSGLYLLVSRFILQSFFKSLEPPGSALIIASPTEGTRIEGLLQSQVQPPAEIIHLQLSNFGANESTLKEIEACIPVHRVQELIFSVPAVSASFILTCMVRFTKQPLKFRVVASLSEAILGGQAPNSKVPLYAFSLLNSGHPSNRRKKRFMEFLLAALFLITAPILMWLMSEPLQFLKNMWSVLSNRRRMVGVGNESIPGPVINLSSFFSDAALSDYVHHYRWENDLGYIVRHFFKLGNKC